MVMYVIKRDLTHEEVCYDKITKRLRSLCFNLSKFIDLDEITMYVKQGVKNLITTQDIDLLAARTVEGLNRYHPDYSLLGGRILASNLQKQTPARSFSSCVHILNKAGLLNANIVDFVANNADALNKMVVANRDFKFDYFGFKTLVRSYLIKVDGTTIETPQYMYLRIACALGNGDLDTVQDIYHDISEHYYTFATPTLFNAGLHKQQMSSCFLLSMSEDSIGGIYKTLTDTAVISKYAGGIGLSIHNVRSSGAHIQGTNGTSNGIVPMLRVFNESSRYVDQGGGKRKGSISIYLPCWHPDIEAFLYLKQNQGKEELRARDLFYALWVSDLFMERVMAKGKWSLFCPSDVPGLAEAYGDDFKELYTKYENMGFAKSTLDAEYIWKQICRSIKETSMPFMLFKDAVNKKSNQQNVGTINCSNLCCEIVQYTSKTETAVCNLASVCLPKFLVDGAVNYVELGAAVERLVVHLNTVIDNNFYPVKEAKTSNERHRPIGIGVQGLADLYIKLGVKFDSDRARNINRRIFATMYFHAVKASMELAKEFGPYSTFEGSPMSRGIFQFDMWGKTPVDVGDWDALRELVKTHGMRNSLLIAQMPTASTSSIAGNTESIEPLKGIIYTRRTNSGEYNINNHDFVNMMEERGLWTKEVADAIVLNGGKVQGVDMVPQDIQDLFITVWDMKMKALINQSIDRAPYVCQTQSLNLYFPSATTEKITSALFYGWQRGLKTGCYYVHSMPKAHAAQVTVESNHISRYDSCSLDASEDCLSCGA